MEHSWWSCSAIAAARAAVVLLRSGPATRLVRLVAIGPPAASDGKTHAHGAEEQQVGSLLHARVRLPHPVTAHFSLQFRSPLVTQSALR